VKISGELNYGPACCRLCNIQGGMTLPLQGQVHSIQITDIGKMTHFGEITGPRSLSVQHYLGWYSSRHFVKSAL